jgi:hypothetical protein
VKSEVPAAALSDSREADRFRFPDDPPPVSCVFPRGSPTALVGPRSTITGYDLVLGEESMNRGYVVSLFAACGVLVSTLVLLAGACAVSAVFIEFRHQERYSRLYPASHLHPESVVLNLAFGYICLTFLLSIIFGATSVGLLAERAWARRAAKAAVPCFSWVLFLGVVWTYHRAPGPSEAMFALGPEVIEAVLAYYVLPWFVAISTLWLVLLGRKSDAHRTASSEPSGRDL